MNNRLYKLMNWPRIEGIIYSEEDRPHEILGPHIVGKSVLFQTFQPGAGKVSLITEDGKKTEMEMVDEAGYFAALVAGKIPDRYEYEICRGKKPFYKRMPIGIRPVCQPRILRSLMQVSTTRSMKSWALTL